MKTITQETSSKTVTAVEPRSRDMDIERDIISLEELLSIASNNYFNSTTSKPSRDSEDVIVTELEPPKRPVSLTPRAVSAKSDAKKDTSADEGEAQKKFGSAKAISSEQYFQDSASDNAVSSSGVVFRKKCLSYSRVAFRENAFNEISYFHFAYVTRVKKHCRQNVSVQESESNRFRSDPHPRSLHRGAAAYLYSMREARHSIVFSKRIIFFSGNVRRIYVVSRAHLASRRPIISARRTPRQPRPQYRCASARDGPVLWIWTMFVKACVWA